MAEAPEQPADVAGAQATDQSKAMQVLTDLKEKGSGLAHEIKEKSSDLYEGIKAHMPSIGGKKESCDKPDGDVAAAAAPNNP